MRLNEYNLRDRVLIHTQVCLSLWAGALSSVLWCPTFQKAFVCVIRSFRWSCSKNRKWSKIILQLTTKNMEVGPNINKEDLSYEEYSDYPNYGIRNSNWKKNKRWILYKWEILWRLKEQPRVCFISEASIKLRRT